MMIDDEDGYGGIGDDNDDKTWWLMVMVDVDDGDHGDD